MKKPLVSQGFRVAAVGFECTDDTLISCRYSASTVLHPRDLRPVPDGTGFGWNGTELGARWSILPPQCPPHFSCPSAAVTPPDGSEAALRGRSPTPPCSR